jgi:hypothetical protein
VVGEEEDGIITFGVYGIEEAAHFVLHEEIEAGRCPAAGGWGVVSIPLIIALLSGSAKFERGKHLILRW